jgi:phage terminase small subunit
MSASHNSKHKNRIKKAKNANRPLSDQQKLFAAEYLKDLNGTQAAIRAGYSPKTAQEQSSRLLSNVMVAKLIADGNQARLAQVEYDSNTLLQELLQENRADMADLFDENNSLLPMREWPLVWRTGLVQGIEIEAIYETVDKVRTKIGEVQKIKISDRIKRKELIGRHTRVQAFKDKVVHDVTDPLQELMKEIIGNSIRPVED